MESSNNSIDQYKEKIESGIIDLRKTWDDAKEAGWTEVKNKNGIVVVTKKEEGSAIQRYAGRTILKGNKETLFNLLKGLDHVAEWDKSFVEGSIITAFDVDHEVIKMRYTAGIPLVSDRDFVYLESRRKFDDGLNMIIAFSVDDSWATVTPGCVRAEILNSGWVFKSVPDQPNATEVLYQLQVNPKGWMPAWLVNMMFVDEPCNVFGKLNELLSRNQNST